MSGEASRRDFMRLGAALTALAGTGRGGQAPPKLPAPQPQNVTLHVRAEISARDLWETQRRIRRRYEGGTD